MPLIDQLIYAAKEVRATRALGYVAPRPSDADQATGAQVQPEDATGNPASLVGLHTLSDRSSPAPMESAGVASGVVSNEPVSMNAGLSASVFVIAGATPTALSVATENALPSSLVPGAVPMAGLQAPPTGTPLTGSHVASLPIVPDPTLLPHISDTHVPSNPNPGSLLSSSDFSSMIMPQTLGFFDTSASISAQPGADTFDFSFSAPGSFGMDSGTTTPADSAGSLFDC
ncbi:hypothetical protein CERSUDRAFT_89270 [Gelatoporia subvermispora B]|uniref:Uncharacterized protein n=1 Tax=Ceriporiopsis subvermispora (strain B) TaxID=914234 RepID=M2P743_CERS8|nr:hypothetical protein CERSUDRAFT_89270 [Gelatoporia subvermispora B]